MNITIGLASIALRLSKYRAPTLELHITADVKTMLQLMLVLVGVWNIVEMLYHQTPSL